MIDRLRLNPWEIVSGKALASFTMAMQFWSMSARRRCANFSCGIGAAISRVPPVFLGIENLLYLAAGGTTWITYAKPEAVKPRRPATPFKLVVARSASNWFM